MDSGVIQNIRIYIKVQFKSIPIASHIIRFYTFFPTTFSYQKDLILYHRGELCVWCDPDLGCNQTQIYCRNTTLTLARLFIADDGRKSTYAHVKTDTVQCGAVVTTIKKA